MRKVTIYISAVWLVFLFASCQKEYSYEGGQVSGGSQPVNFILEGDPDSCFDFIVNGNYHSGTALTIDNTVKVMVNVTAIGPYSIKTNKADGISFSHSGIFISTGSQELVLQGTGTPVKTGTFTFKPNSGSSSCSFSVTVAKEQPPATYQMASNADGSCSSYQTPSSIYHGTTLNSNNTITVTVNVDIPGDFNISTNTVNGMTFSNTGNFSTPGLQKVQLNSRGTPVEIGVFVLTPYVVVDDTRVGSGCNLDVYVF